MTDKVTGLDRRQLVAKIAHDITKYSATDQQVKLSLLQELIIVLLADSESSMHAKLKSIQCHFSSENVTGWLDAMMAAYLRSDGGAEAFGSLTPEQVAAPY